jgi:transposase
LERVQLLLQDWRNAHDRLADTEARMTGVLDELGLTRLVTSITGISAVGAAAILAQTGDPRRFATARALVNTPASRHGRSCLVRSSAAPS